MLLSTLKRYISVYDGIAPSLLATLSIAQGIKGTNHKQLVQSLRKNNIVQSTTILQALSEIDRKIFTNDANPYDNKPNIISQGQKMTDILTHSIILQNCEEVLLRNNCYVLDIGTGHGYLPYTISKMWKLANIHNCQIKGIDINQQSIHYCNKLKEQYKDINDSITFEKEDIQNIIKNNEKFDVIIGGFFIQQEISDELQKKITDNGLGLWPASNASGQALYKFSNGKRTELISTLFSARKVISPYSQYFHDQTSMPQQQQIKPNRTKSQQEKLNQLRKTKKIQKDSLNQLLKQKLLAQKQRNGRVPTLAEMKNISEIQEILQKLKKL